jgi:HAD superfamily hydrolase (TIGR01509 family)
MTSPKWSNTTKTWVLIGLVVLLLLAVYVLRDLLAPLGLAFVVAYLLKPLADQLERRARMPRVWATVAVFLALILVFSAIPVTVVPLVVSQSTLMLKQLQGLLGDLQVWMDETAFLSRTFLVLGFEFRPEQLLSNLQGSIESLVQPFFSQTLDVLFGIASSLLWVITILLVSFYTVKDAERLKSFLDRLAPPGYGTELRRLRQEVSSVWRSFFRGQLVLGLVVGTTVAVAMSIVGLPNAGLMGLIAGILESIPNFGPIVAAIPAVLTALLRGSSWLPISNLWFAVLVTAVYVLIQQIENQVLVPRIMGGRLKLHPAVVMVSLLAGGIVLGLVGVFLAAPVTGTLRVILRYFQAKLLERDPYPDEVKPPPEEFFPGEIDAVLFDLDGTLVETDDDAVAAMAHRLRPLARILPKRDPQLAARRLVMSLDRPVTRILTLAHRVHLDDNLAGLAQQLYRLRGVRPSSDLRPMVGVVEMLRGLDRPYCLAIVTNRSHREAEAFLEQQGLAGMFDVVTGREDTWHLKPHPAPVTHTIRRLGVPPERCLMVGDTASDVVSARRAGARTAAVLCGFGTRGMLEEAHASLVFGTTAELGEWL